MRQLVSIGRFARLTQLSVKALRLYDQAGVLPPALIDVHSAFRYYSREAIGQGSLEVPGRGSGSGTIGSGKAAAYAS